MITSQCYYDKIVRELQLRATLTPSQARVLNAGYSHQDYKEFISTNNTMLVVLQDERCKRILFDSRQASTYIPKTSHFQSGKEQNPIMDRYFTKE